jgi:hypothetical protein
MSWSPGRPPPTGCPSPSTGSRRMPASVPSGASAPSRWRARPSPDAAGTRGRRDHRQPGVMQGGLATNIVPDHVVVGGETRSLSKPSCRPRPTT